MGWVAAHRCEQLVSKAKWNNNRLSRLSCPHNRGTPKIKIQSQLNHPAISESLSSDLISDTKGLPPKVSRVLFMVNLTLSFSTPQWKIWSTGETPRRRAWCLVCPCCCCCRWQPSASSAWSPTCCSPCSVLPSPSASTSLWSRLCRSPATVTLSSKAKRQWHRSWCVFKLFQIDSVPTATARRLVPIWNLLYRCASELWKS